MPSPPLTPGSWDCGAVGRWLEAAGFGELTATFAAQRVDGEVLLKLTVADLQQLKVPLGQAKKLLDCLAELQRHKRTAHPRVTWSAGDAASAGSADGMAPLWPTDPNSACQIVLLMGPPGSGKSTLGDRLAARIGAEHVDLGVELRSEAKSSSKSGSAESMVINLLMTAMEKGREKVAAGKGAHVVLVNGYPRMMDGFAFWGGLGYMPQPSLVLVLEAPDDVLRARVQERDRPDDKRFNERLAFFRKETQPVCFAYHDLGITRYLDATGGMDFVEASALSHLQPSVVFACGRAELYRTACRELQSLSPKQFTLVSVDAIPGTAEMLVHQLQVRTRSLPGQLILLEGFPRCAEDLKAWQQSGDDAILTLDFQSEMSFSGCFSRRFENAEEESIQAASKLIRSCQPLHMAVPHAATALLKNWMDAARYTQWWDVSHFQSFQTVYMGYMRDQVSTLRTEQGFYGRPTDSPPLQAWLVWMTHMLYASKFSEFCQKTLKRTIGPLPPPLSSGLTRAKRKEYTSKKTDLKLQVDALANAPMAFVDALAALQTAGLSPLSDPRALCFGASQPSGVGAGLVKLLGLYYRRFLLVMGEAGSGSEAGPSAEMDWVWHGHTMHPAIYEDDCRRLFGHVMHHIPCSPSDQKSTPKDQGQRAMQELNRLMRNKLKDFAQQHQEDFVHASSWPFRRSTEDDDVITLGCFIKGGDRSWLSEQLRMSGSMGAALADSLQNPEKWNCPCPASVALERDPDMLDVTVRLLSGETLMEKTMDKSTKVAEIETFLRSMGETENLKLFVDGEQLTTSTTLGETNVVSGSIISVVRVKKPPPPVRVVRREPSSDSDIRCTCFTDSCEFHVLEGKNTVVKGMRELREGDVVHTGSHVKQDQFQRVTRIWRCPAKGTSHTVELQPGLRLTTGHPVSERSKPRWCRPEELGRVETTREAAVYTIELEGHVDTVLVGRDKAQAMIVAALGVYCGESFGWNLFTRKTRPCDLQNCKKCAVAVVPSMDFSVVTPEMLEARYAPY